MATSKLSHRPIEPIKLFSINGTYLIDPKTTSAELQEDISCLIECVGAIVNCVMDGMQEDDGQMQANPRQVANLMYGADYMLQMIGSMNIEATRTTLTRQRNDSA